MRTGGDCVFSERGGVIENRHKVHASVVDATGKLLFYVGDPLRTTLVRSAAKPVQALAVIETGGFDQFKFDEADLALMCASHSSEERHIARTFNMLAKVQAEETDLRCGGHPALSNSVNRNWIKRSFNPTAACNNCSGKHVGMLAGTKAIGADIATYHHPTHPLQSRVKQVFQELCALESEDVRWGIDGCNLPAPAVPLHCLGRIYAIIAASADNQIKPDAFAYTRMHNMGRIFHAMTKYPELVGGDGRFCTVLMQAFQGRVIGKLGADGCYGVGIRASEQTAKFGATGAVGISLKIEDGNITILYSAVLEVLEQLGIKPPEIRTELDAFHHPAISNTAGVITGHITPAFKLHTP
ncbi:L-asparaginase II [Aspergillus insuetus]